MRLPLAVAVAVYLSVSSSHAGLLAVGNESGQSSFLAPTTLGFAVVGDDTYHIEAPVLAGDGNGNWLATWPDQIPVEQYSELGLRQTLSSDDAVHWSAPAPLHTEGYPAALASSAVAAPDGTMLVAWPKQVGPAIAVRRSTDGGASWSEAVDLYVSDILLEPEDSDQEITNLRLVRGANGRIVASWSEGISEHGPCTHDDCIDWEDITRRCAIRRSFSDDDGQTWSPAADVAGTCGDRDVELATDGNGSWVVAWRDFEFYGPDNVTVSVSTDDAEHWSESRKVLEHVGVVGPLSLAASPDGDWLLAASLRLYDPASEQPGHLYWRIFVSHTQDPGGSWSEPAGIAPWHDTTDGTDRFPSMAAAEDGTFGIAWSSLTADSGNDADIVASYSTDGGVNWTSPQFVASDANGDTRSDISPRLVRAGKAWGVVWRAVDGSQQRMIRFARTRGSCGDGILDPNEACDDHNAIDGDGCDISCSLTACGNGVVTDGEECDDGNGADDDACIACRDAFCGDGFVNAGIEECDDANLVDTDGCLVACTLARCGDGVVQPGVEVCDDAEPDNNGACLQSCSPASCGDGYLELGVEGCDDGNALNGDGCSKNCRPESPCIFLNSSGLRVTATDALKVLRKGVGMRVTCPLRNCDLDGDGRVSASDSLRTLGWAVGLFPSGCEWPDHLVLRMTSSELFGALQFRFVYRDAAGHIVEKPSGAPDCEPLVPAYVATNLLADAGELRVGVVSLQGIQGPVDLLRCRFDPVSGPSLHDFDVVVEDASYVTSMPIEPPPAVVAVLE